MALKSLLNDTLQNLLKPIRDKRNSITADDALEVLTEGSKQARKIATQTVEEVREAIGILKF